MIKPSRYIPFCNIDKCYHCKHSYIGSKKKCIDDKCSSCVYYIDMKKSDEIFKDVFHKSFCCLHKE